jgi:broad specificity phosphatase PhoE
MPVKFIFLRHGEATHNVAFHVEGTSAFSKDEYKDAPLTQKGIDQAKEAGTALASLKILDIWSSPLSRCIHTAQEVFEEVNATSLYLHDHLLERQGGDTPCNERKCKSQIKYDYPIWDVKHLPDLPALWIRCEDSYTLRQRMYMFVMLLADLYKDESDSSHVLLVSHSDAIAALTGKVLKNAEYVVLTLAEILQ